MPVVLIHFKLVSMIQIAHFIQAIDEPHDSCKDYKIGLPLETDDVSHAMLYGIYQYSCRSMKLSERGNFD